MTDTRDRDELGKAPARAPRVLGFVALKLGGGALSLLLVVVLGFFLFRVLPGDPARTMTRSAPVSAEQLAALRHRFGLDQPLYVQFRDFLGNLVRGDLGTSYTYNRPVAELIGERIGPTVLLVGTATVLAVLIGLWMGTRAAWRHGGPADRWFTSVGLTLWSVPTFWLGLLLLMALGVGVGPLPGLFPVSGMSSPDVPPGALPRVLDVAHHLVLPCVTLVAVIHAQFMMVMRSSLLEEMGEEYLTTARAKGLREDLVRRRHAIPNALLPTVTLIFLHLGLVVSGAITVETVFSWPGLGLLTYEALRVPDLPLLQGTFIVLAGSVIVMNVLAELLYRVLDPRVRAS
ncbi:MULTISPECIES: ABC transporter permease [Actinopolyspora]|uniref:Peptide/nickel transport system permease protein n=1 Tax=Actinopolyspora saharensis TaxID=995062 RepID=A0A1H0YBG0_9ACTN|nr:MULTISPECIES: ABC transporter permease [Actinopolyspora]NHD17653.1 ABC transporter permease [Actinopolyspora sp. BKK2]NHE76614.1 ABC transporter permease [Actinopolyspora sp. BKK1]SDQ12467.1 peptide/nickel transport system permease protein [Actinopolyspora saharensis]